MASSLVDTVNVEDPMISNIQTNLQYAVYNGCQSITPQSFPAISASTSNIIFNVQMPNETTLLRARMMLRGQLTLALQLVNNNNVNVSIGQILGYGGVQNTVVTSTLQNNRSAFAPFPFHQLMTTMTLTLNNNTFDININQCLHAFLRLWDYEKSRGLNSTTPTMQDYLQNYSDMLGLAIDSLAAFGNGDSIYNQGRGSFVASFSPALSTVVTAAGGTQQVLITIDVAEPLMLSPMTWIEDVMHRSGMYGLQTLNLQINLDSSAKRFFRTSAPVGTATSSPSLVNKYGIYGVTLNGVSNVKLDLLFCTPKPSSLLPPINCHPYCQFVDYHKTDFSIPSASAKSIQSQTLSLNQIPDGIFVCVKKALSNQTISDADFYLPLEGDYPLNITFNNVTGLLSTANRQELFMRTQANGVFQTWQCFDKYVNVFGSSGSLSAPTCGGLLYLKFGQDIAIPELFYSSGSIGQFQLQLSINVANTTGVDIDQNNAYDLVIIVVNSGNCILERGQTTTYTGVLTKERVLDAMKKPAFSYSDVRRVVGGGFFDTLKSVASKVKNIAAPLLDIASIVPIPAVQKAAQIGKTAVGVADKLGLGQTAGAKDARLM